MLYYFLPINAAPHPIIRLIRQIPLGRELVPLLKPYLAGAAHTTGGGKNRTTWGALPSWNLGKKRLRRHCTLPEGLKPNARLAKTCSLTLKLRTPILLQPYKSWGNVVG